MREHTCGSMLHVAGCHIACDNMTYGKAPMLQQSCFSEVLHEDVTVHFQLICMPNQIFVWISHGPTQLGQLCAAMPQARSLVAAEHHGM